MTDIIIAKGGISRADELNFAKALHFLGTESILLLTSPKKQSKMKRYGPDIPQVKVSVGYVFDETNAESSQGYPDYIKALDCTDIEHEKIREIIEKQSFDIIINFCKKPKKKTTHFPHSSLSHVTADLMRQKSMTALFSPHDFINMRSALFNARILRERKVRTAFCSLAYASHELRNEKDLLATGSALGFSDKDIKESSYTIEALIKKTHYMSYSVTAGRQG